MECVLCGRRAMMYCESDLAMLCCDCDEKVHGANFLVAKHHRSLLCYACQSLTPWTASGPKLTPTVSVCEGCVHSHRRKCDRGTNQESQGCNEVDDDGSYEVSESEGGSEEEEEEEEEDDDEHEEEDGENQVVPWSHASSPPPPSPPAASSSSEGFSAAGGAKKTLKRKGETGDASDSDDEIRSSSSQQGRETSDESSSPTSFRSPKHLRPTIDSDQLPTNQDLEKLRSTDNMNSIKRLQTTMTADCNEASGKNDSWDEQFQQRSKPLIPNPTHFLYRHPNHTDKKNTAR